MTRKAPSHRFFRAAVCLSLGVAVGACDMTPSVPLQTAFALAAESHPMGRRVDVLQGDTLFMRIRTSMGGARIYDDTGIRLGRLRPDSDGWLLQNRLGETLCEIPGETLGLVLRCGDLPAVEIEYDATGHLSVQRNGEPVASIRFEAGQGTLTLPSGPDHWTATEGSAGIELRTADGDVWRIEPPGLSLPAALSLAIPPQLSEEAGAARLERAAVAWMVHRALLEASHEGSAVALEGSAGEGSAAALEGSVLEGSTAALEGSVPSHEGSGSAEHSAVRSLPRFAIFGGVAAPPTAASMAMTEGSTPALDNTESPTEASVIPTPGSEPAAEASGVIPE